MRYALLLFLGSVMWGQAYTFPQVSNDLGLHGLSAPLPCPDTTNPGVNCTTASGAQQALTGANSIWAECDFSTTAPLNSPECPAHTNPATQVAASSTAAAIANQNYVHIVRATDYSMGSHWTATWNGAQMADNSWDSTNTRLVLGNSSGGYSVFSLDPNPAHTTTYLQVTKLYGSTNILSTNSWFSRQPPSTFVSGQTVSYWYALMRGDAIPGYNGSGPGLPLTALHVYLTRWDFSNSSTLPSLTAGTIIVLRDFTTAGCLGASYDNSGNSRPYANGMTVSYDDNYFEIPIVNSGCSGGGGPPNCTLVTNGSTFNTLVVYSKSADKCSVWNTNPGTTSNPSGTAGGILDAGTGQNFTSNTTGDGSPNFFVGGLMYAEINYCLPVGTSGPCGNSANTNTVRYTWETGFAYPQNASPSGNRAFRFGNASHRAAGFSHYITYPGENGVWFYPNFVYNYDGSGSTWLNTGTVPPQNICYVNHGSSQTGCAMDDHKSWVLNTGGTDNAPVMAVTSYDGLATSTIPNDPLNGPKTPLPVPWSMEVLLWPTTCYPSCTSNKPWRVMHTFQNSNVANLQTSDYSMQMNSAAISSQPSYGHIFIALTSTWQGQLGCTNGSYDTTGNAGGIGMGCPSYNVRTDVFIASVPVTSPATTYYYPWHN